MGPEFIIIIVLLSIMMIHGFIFMSLSFGPIIMGGSLMCCNSDLCCFGLLAMFLIS